MLSETLSIFLRKIADDKIPNSLSAKLRKKRFILFKYLFDSVSIPLKLIDVGGTKVVWEREGFCDYKAGDVEIVILNNYQFAKAPHLEKSPQSNIINITGDARDMKQFKDNEFDIVYSNSVIEHLGNYEDQRRMANEVKRIGKRYFLQTPNLHFPIEPHFMFPFFQFLPFWLRVWLLTHFSLGWCGKFSDNKQGAIEFLNTFRLLSKKELIDLFPDATLYEEKFLGLTKSFVVYNGWDVTLPE